MIDYQTILGVIASIISLVGSVVYIRSILQGRTKPHLYTWLIFAILTTIALIAQIVDGAGPGAWMMAVTALSCGTTALLSLKYGEKSRTVSDRFALLAALLAIVPWLFTKDPLLSVIMISLIDGIAMIPTIRKSWHNPYQENLPTFWLANLKNVIALFALKNFTLTTSFYLISICFVNTALILVCLHRRRVVEKQKG